MQSLVPVPVPDACRTAPPARRCGAAPVLPQGTQQLYTTTTPNTIGPRNIKARYVAYTDVTFTNKAPADAKLGVLGPLIQTQVRIF